MQPGETQPATPRDVTQGAVGDCWFVSAAGAVAAADPGAVKRMITDHGDGTYTVTLHLLDAKGVRQAKPVKIDAKLPQTAGGAALGAAGPDLWVGLLEKALAAVLGGYDQVGGGSSEEALAILSGISGTTIDLAALGERGFDDIATALAEKKPVVANTPHALHLKESLKDNQPLLLSRLTQRALLGIPEGGHQWMVATADASGRKITVRNPWGGATAEITVTSAQFVALWSTAVIGSAPPPAPPH